MSGRSKFRARRLATDASGQAMVEFALVITFVVILFVAVLEMIFLMHTYNTLADAAKEGVRYAIVHGTGSSTANGGVGCSGPGTATGVIPSVTCTADTSATYVKNAVTKYADLSMQNVTNSNVNVDYNPNSVNPSSCSQPGCMVKVTVSYVYHPFFGLGWPSVTIHAAADGRIMY
jgi:Flp pilus assembly protein TadG